MAKRDRVITITPLGRSGDLSHTRVRIEGLVYDHRIGGKNQDPIVPAPLEFDVPVPAHMGSSKELDWWMTALPLCAVIAGLAWDSVDTSLRKHGVSERPVAGPPSDVHTALTGLSSEMKAASFDAYWLLFHGRHSPAFAMIRKATECWIHSRLLVHFGSDAAKLYVDDLQQTARSRRHAEVMDAVLSLGNPGSQEGYLLPLVKAARQELDPTRTKWPSHPYWWLEGTPARGIQTFEQAFQWIISNDPPLPWKNAETNKLYVYIFRSLVQHSHMWLHPDPKMLRRGDAGLGHESNLMAVGLSEVCMNFRELLASVFDYEESHVNYANILRSKLASIGLFRA